MLPSFRYSVRRLVAEGPYTLIHIVGLALGVAACLLLLLYIQHELSFDRFHPDADRVVQLVSEKPEMTGFSRGLPVHVASDVAERLPSVVAGAALAVEDDMLIDVGGERRVVGPFGYTTPALFDVLGGFETLAGDLAVALRQPDGAVLTRTLAATLFGSTDAALGQTLATVDESVLDRSTFEEEGRMQFDERGEVPYTVRAVVEDPPTTSTVQFGLLVPHVETGFRGWNVSGAEAFLRLQPGVDQAAFESELARYMEDHAFSYGEGQPRKVTGTLLHAQPLTDVHLHTDLSAPEGQGGTLALFGGAAVLILLIASINYVNLATARAVRRAREVGVRKAVGAGRGQLWRLFLIEAAVVVAVAMALGLTLAAAALPWFSEVLGAGLHLGSLATPLGLAVLSGLFVVITLGSGALPAFVLSAFRPVTALKGVPAHSGSGAWLRRGLVVVQFVASVGLVIAMLGTDRQMDYIRAERLDALDDQVVVVDNRSGSLDSGYEPFKQALLASSSVESVTTGAPPGGGQMMLFNALREGGEPTELNLILAGEDYVETLGLVVVSGTGLDAAPPASADTPILINQAAVRASDLASLPTPVGALDTPFNRGDVVGVVEDYHFRPLREPIGPLAILPATGAQSQVLVRLREGHIADGLATVETVWDDYVADRPLQYAFLDETLDEVYRADLRMIGLFRAFAWLAISIAAMGLFGLAAYTAESRRKEVGIRKALGASTPRLVGLLSRDFLALVAVSFALGAPLAFIGLRRWLDGFAYHATPGVGLALTTAAIVVAVALVAVGGQALRAALADPIHALRTE